MPWGLSSLGRLEGRVDANLRAVEAALARLCEVDGPAFPTPEEYFSGETLLAAETAALLGPGRAARNVRILVTCGVETAERPELFDALIHAGAEAVRINCAHDEPAIWAAIVGQVEAAHGRRGRRLRVLMDLGGPKCRTGQVLLPTDRKRLVVGDRLRLVAPGTLAGDGFVAECTLPEVLMAAKVGHRVMIDDGKCGGVVETADRAGLVLRIDHAPADGRKLKPDKGLNFPSTELRLSPLTDKDLEDLDFIAGHADIVGYSFVQEPDDIRRLQAELAVRRPTDWRKLGLVAKIETPRAVRNLPEIIVTAAGQQPFGVMIARGDLAVELGFERLAEMQEEIVWLCEAAHVPVIWATQVLESLVKDGMPSRGEMTDAVMAGRAECVMLNKGPHVVEAVAVLDRLLARDGRAPAQEDADAARLAHLVAAPL